MDIFTVSSLPAIYVNEERIYEMDYILTKKDQLDGEMTVIRRGKKKYFLLSYR